MRKLIHIRLLFWHLQYEIQFFHQTVSLSNDLQSQDANQKLKEKEILKDLESVKSKADEVLQKLGTFRVVNLFQVSPHFIND